MAAPFRSAWIITALILLVLAVLLVGPLAGRAWAMPLEPGSDPRSPTRMLATITVQSDADDGTANAANCPGAGCRLRDALAYASPGDTITFDGDYTITLVSELTIGQDVTIDGTGHSVTISGNDAVRVFNVATGHVTFAHLTIVDGNAPVTASGCGGYRCGGGILLQNSGVVVTVTHSTLSGNVAAYDGDNGGGIYNNGGTLTVQDSTLSGNHSGYYGGGIYNNGGTVTVQDSTLSGNQADVGAGVSNAGVLTITHSTLANNTSNDFGSFGNGGGLRNSSGTAALTNVTFSGNQAINAAGGGVRVDDGSVTLTNVTLSGNSATTGGGISQSSGSLTITNSIVANNLSGGNCSGTGSGTNSLADDATCGAGFTNSSSIQLGVLGDYDGSTPTVPLLPGSAASDATSTNCPATDQRGVARSALCDIGAFESRGFTLTKTGGDNQSTLINTAFTDPLALSVTSAYSEPVNGGAITFVGPLSGAGTNPITSTAIIMGDAVSQSVMANGTGGSYTVTASTTGAANVTFALTNTCASAIVVTNSADNGAGSLRQALVEVCPDGAITFAGDYTITLTSQLTIDRNVTIDGGVHAVAVSGNNAVRVFTVNMGVAFNLLNLTVAHGATPTGGAACPTYCGGGVYNLGALKVMTSTLFGNNAVDGGGLYSAGTVTVTNSTFISNSARWGAGISNDTGSALTVMDSTFSGNSVNSFGAGGGIHNVGLLTVTNSTFSGNYAYAYGGAIENDYNSMATVMGSTFISNSSYSAGGAIENYNSGTLIITNSTFISNSSSSGGGIYTYDRSQLAVTNSAFVGNHASSTGGGILSDYGGTLTVTNNTFSDNSAARYGGGIETNGLANIANSTFSGNSAVDYGGGIDSDGTLIVTDSIFTGNSAEDGGGIESSNTLTVTNSTFSGNSATTSGGGGLSNWGTLTMVNSTFANNNAAEDGGGLYNWGTLTVTNSTFASNSATIGGGIYHYTGTASVRNSTLADNSASTGDNCSGETIDGSNNLANDASCGAAFTESATIRLGVLGDYGGSTPTVPLLPGSAAIDAGDAVGCPITDQRGVTRPQGIACDIGAFEADVYVITPTAGVNGSMAPDTPQLVYRGGSQTFLILPETGYQIVDVLVDGIAQGPIGLYTFNNVTASHTISATFTNTTYTITPASGAHGSISPNAPQTVNHGGSATFTFTPDVGYQVTEVMIDGVSQGAANSYTFSNVTADHTIAVSFAIKTYTITPSAGANGSITPTTPQTVNHGDNVTFNITPDTGYHIAGVIVDGVSQGAITTYTFNNVTANHTIATSFAINTYTLTPGAGPNGSISPDTPQIVNYGSSKTFNIMPNAGYHIVDVVVDGVSQGPIGTYTFNAVAGNHTITVSFALNTYTIVPSAGANGSISPNTPQTVNHGGSITFNFTPNSGSQVANVLVDGVAQGPLGSYTFSNVSANRTIAVLFTGETYLLTPSAGPNGVISPYTPQTVNHGGSATFTITPNTGYHLAEVLVDDVSQGAITSYTFNNVTANHTIAASFAINTYTLSPSAGSNGSIIPSTPQTLNYGGSQTFNIAANPGYRIAEVRVDGVSQGTPGSYTFNNVTANHTITAAFTTSGPQTRVVGVITVTADSFTNLGGGVTRVTGNIRLGDYLFLTGGSDEVLYTSTTLTATGKLTVRSDHDQIDVFTGSFRASTSNGSATLIGTPTYHLNQVADWPLVAGISVSSIDLSASKMNVTASVGVQVYEIDATVPVTFALAGTTNDLVYSGTLGKFDFSAGGLTVTVASGATVSNIGISIPSATVTLPAKLGGASGTIAGLSITKYGVTIEGGNIALPEIKYGDGSKVKITGAEANLSLATDTYRFTVSATLQITLPGNLINTPVSFTIENGEMSGTIDQLDLTVAGAQLELEDVAIGNGGLAVAQATLTLPASLGGATTTLTEVSINSDGLSIGSGSLQLAEIKIGDGSKVKIVNPIATLSAQAGGYTFGISGTLQLRLPQNNQNIALNGNVNSSGQFTATLSQITLKLANVDLKLSNITMNNSGLTVVSGTLQLPAKLGSVSGVVNNIAITANGLSIEGGAVTFPIPNFKLGGSSGFSVSNARAKLIMTNNGASYRLQIDGTVAIAVRGSNASATGTFSVDDAGNLSGSVSTFALAVAGLTLNAQNIAINNDGSLAVGAADLKLPSGFGGAAASVYNVSLGNGELSIGGGKFTLPEIKAGGFRLKDLGASLLKVSGGYEISAKGFASFPAVSGGAGCKGIGVSATLFVNALGQTELALSPTQPAGLSLKEAAFNFECQIPIGTTGFNITGLSGAVTLGETSTQVNLGLQIATSRKIADMAVLSADAQAQLISDPFDLSITGAVRVFTFQVGGASAHLTSNNFSATLWVNMIAANGSISFNAWSDYRGFHMNGTGNMTVGFAKGSIFNSLSIPYPCCDCSWQWSWGVPYWWCGDCRTCWTAGITVPPSDWLFNTGTEFGEFTGDRWGVKGTVSLLGYSAGFFVDHLGNFSVGNVDNYRLVQPLQVLQAAQKWQAAKLGGLATPSGAWEVDGFQFTGDSIIVNQALTTTTDVIFALQRNQSTPTLTLMTPLGVEITPNDLPANVQFAEVLTYTRNISPGLTTAAAQMVDGVSACVSPQAWQGAEQTALVRFTHARSDLGTVDVLIDNVQAFGGLGFGAESSEQVIEAGPRTIALVPAGQPGPILSSMVVTLTGNAVHRLIVAGDLTHTATLDLVQGIPPATGQATLRFAHASPDAPSLDVVLGNTGRILFSNSGPWSTTTGVNLESGKPYTFEVYAAGTNQLLAQLPNVTLTGRGTYSLIALGRLAGTPALQLVMQADTLPLSQLRLVNAIAADQSIEMWTQGITLFANLPFSATTPYNGFASSSIGFQLTPAGISNTILYSGSVLLQGETDHTLVALDYVTQTQTMLLVDDNTLPGWGKTRVRLVHASRDVPAVDVGVQGGATWFNDVAYMNASSYHELDGGSVTLEVRDHATSSVLLTVPNVNLVDGYVYTLFLIGVNGGSPALQLVPQVDLVTLPDVQAQYVVHQAQTGMWGMKLNGNIAATDQYMLTMLGSNPAPTLTDLSTGISGTTALTTSWRLTSDELGTPLSIYANPGPITAGLFVTDDFIYTGQALAKNLTSNDPSWINGSLQTQTIELNHLPSGTYRLWFEANDDRNTPVRRYAPHPIVVDHTASWSPTWTAVLTLTSDFREVNVQWQPHPNADVDGYVLNVASSHLTETLVISAGNSTAASVTALDPGRPYSLTLHALDNETGHVSQSQTVIGLPEGAPFTLRGSTDAINLIAGQSQPLLVTLTAGKEPYPGVAGVQVGCVHQIGAACDLSISGLTALFSQELVTPTLAGATVPVVISATETLAAGTYVVPIMASGNGLSHTLEVAVMIQTQDIVVTAPNAVTLGQDQTLALPIATTGTNGASAPIGLRVDNVPAGLRWSLDRNTLLPGENATLSITDTVLLKSGVYTLDILGDDGLHTSIAHLSLSVSKPRFTLTAPAAEQVVPFGWARTAMFALDVTPLDGWADPVTLVFDPDSAPALGAVGLTRDPVSGLVASTLVITPTGRVYLLVSTKQDTPPGQYTLTVEAEAGGREQTLTLRLAVKRIRLYLPLIMRQH